MDDNSNFFKDYTNNINILKTNSVMLKETASYLVACSKDMDILLDYLLHPEKLHKLDNTMSEITKIQNEMNVYISLAIHNMNTLSDFNNSSDDEDDELYEDDDDI